MSNYIVSDSDLTSVANAIRAKSGGSGQLVFPAGFVSEIESIPSGGGQTLTKLASGTHTLAADATSIVIPVSYAGTVKYVFCEVDEPIADTAQAVSWQCAFGCPTGDYTQYDYMGIVQSRGANNSLVNAPQYIKPVLSASSITLGRQSSYYPINANDYKWEIWGYAS